MNSQDIFDYYDWLKVVRNVVEQQILLVTNNPNDPTVVRTTEELTANGYSLRGQDIETSRVTGNVFIRTDLLTFAEWFKQKETSSAAK